jgi:hypothetical protein
MSELKAISGHEIREDIDYNTRGIDPENKEWCNYGKELCDTLYYRKSEADEAIDELKAKLENVQASMYADVVDANMENRRLRRALWIARAEWARSSALSYHLIESHPDKDVSATYKRKANKWEKAKDKCLNKAEEYR